MGRRASILALAGLALLAAAVPARAAVTIGSNLASPHADNMPGCNVGCTATNLALPAANRAPGGHLTSPVNGTVIAWRARANTGLNLSLRVLRPFSGTTFTGAGTSLPASFGGPGVSPFFFTSLPISTGDSIGLNSPNANLILAATAGATQLYWKVPPLADGSTRAGTAGPNKEVLVQAIVEPTSALSFGKLKRNKKKGIAKVKVTIPNAGVLRTSGKKVRVGGRKVRSFGGPTKIRVKIRARGKKRSKLVRKGKVKVKPIFTFTPFFGNVDRQPKKIKLFRKRKR